MTPSHTVFDVMQVAPAAFANVACSTVNTFAWNAFTMRKECRRVKGLTVEGYATLSVA